MDQAVQNRLLERRLRLHRELAELLGTAGEDESRVYFQPPESVEMRYPAIVYKKDDRWDTYANNGSYVGRQRYSITVISDDPDCSLALEILAHFPFCSIDRSFTADNLNHDVLTLYF